jgi:NAD(P)-dependent dehydrogenase (short-subunit alcohol dehydrogenase family)
MRRLEGCSAIVTGAPRGIGRGIARAFADGRARRRRRPRRRPRRGGDGRARSSPTSTRTRREETVPAVVLLASRKGSYITGAVLNVSGGHFM